MFISTLLTSIYAGSHNYFAKLEHANVVTRIAFYRATLDSFLKRYQQLPYILAKDPRVIAGLEDLSTNELNLLLKDFTHRAGLEAIFLIDMSGHTIASSNSGSDPTFVGQNYSFRPYFRDARSGKTGQYFAIGTTTTRPGYFISEPVLSSGGIVLGVIVVKLDMQTLQNTLRNHRDTILVSDQNSIIILASQTRLLYKAIQTIPENKRLSLRKNRQYGTHELDRVKWIETTSKSVKFEGTNFLYARTESETSGWKLHLLATTQRANERAISTSIITGALLTSVLALAAFVRSNRVRAALMASEKANVRLSTEIAERNAVERQLTTAQQELERQNKLATLGQLAACVTHELGQPIAALKTYIAAEELRKNTEHQKKSTFLKNVKSISERMDGITHQLRFFAQSPDREREVFDLRELKSSVFNLVQHDIKANDITFRSYLCNQAVIVVANRLRIEQVLVNFITNAISAVEGQLLRQVTLSITKEGEQALISVSDTGVGFNDATLEDMQEPFFTTRNSGKGLGLGLAIVSTIIREHAGSIDVASREPTGAQFWVRLPLSNNKRASND
ncbi:MAG: sensor histidine kinase [Hyphomicrobiaceae bacterium]|nr:sensor histidine kinase [Hyphomicrobiaceae bacterium]